MSRLGNVMLATLQLAATKSDRTKGEVPRPGNMNSIFLLSDPKLTKALNTVSLEEQEPGDLVDAERIEAYCQQLEHDQSLNPTYRDKDKPDLTDIKLSKLTKREVELTKLLWQGYTTTEVSKYWHRSELTVNKHRENLNSKLGHRAAPRDLSMILAADALINSV